MSKKFPFNPILGSYELLNKSYNKIKVQGSALLKDIREYLEDDDVRRLLTIYKTDFESFRFEIFDLEMVMRLEIDLSPKFNAIRTGKLVTYLFKDGALVPTKVEYFFDDEKRLYSAYKPGEPFAEMSDFIIDYIEVLVNHITQAGYVSIPNSTYEGTY